MISSNSFSFILEKTVGKSRAGTFTTPHGTVQTPMFMPVGTQATVKALDSQDTEATKASIILANTYHLYLRPGMERMQQAGGLHKFMNWDKPILTDSGGFQVFSLGKQMEMKHEDGKLPNIQTTSMVKIADDGVHFVSHLDGTKHFFSPEKAIEIQRQIGADIIMAFDECTPDKADAAYAQEALDRTHRWAHQCKEYWESVERKNVYGKYQALFGIVQGGSHQELRQDSAREIVGLDFDGVAIGGETVGYNMPLTVEIMDWLRDILPEDKPRYAMGLGRDPQNLIDAVQAGYDIFDCVAPTRIARNGALYVGELDVRGEELRFESEFEKGRLQIGNNPNTRDERVIQPGCDCFTCQSGYTRNYLNHLYKTKELIYFRLASIHNVRFMIRLMEQARAELLRM
jgi:queuine tRNA-ribosyltransferase